MATFKPRKHRLRDPRTDANGNPPPLQPLFSARVEPEVRQKAEEWLETSKWTKRQLAEYALEMVFENLDPIKAREIRESHMESSEPV